MAKRFTDTDKWKKRSIRNMPVEYKLFWMFLCDDCDNAGIWHVDFDVASLYLGVELIPETALEILKDKVIPFDNGEKWFIPSFIEFQYGELSDNNKAHLSVISKLKKHGLINLIGKKDEVLIPLPSPFQGAMDKDKDMDMVQAEEGGVIGEGDESNKFDAVAEFESVWNKYPDKSGKKSALSHFRATVRTDDDVGRIKTALENYMQSDRVKRGFIKNGSTWFNDWQAWVEPTETMMRGNNATGANSNQKNIKPAAGTQAARLAFSHGEAELANLADLKKSLDERDRQRSECA